MNTPHFLTPEEAEIAFYQAFESADLDIMMRIWSPDDGIACVHPMGKMLRGQTPVREGWRQIFRSGERMHFEVVQEQRNQDQGIAVHVVTENIYLHGEVRARPPVVATNIYKLTELGWRMIVHHASPSVLNTLDRELAREPSSRLRVH